MNDKKFVKCENANDNIAHETLHLRYTKNNSVINDNQIINTI